jgi:hypothetical protein
MANISGFSAKLFCSCLPEVPQIDFIIDTAPNRRAAKSSQK